MSDIAVSYDPETMTFSWDIAGSGLASEDGLYTAVLLSLFSDRAARPDDVLPDSGTDRRGWWADAYAEVAGDQWGSRLWLLSREKETTKALRKAEEYAYEALKWMIEDRVVSTIVCRAEIPRSGILALTVTLTRGKNITTEYRFETFWKGVS